jgi:HAMP domain-containing protein
MYDSKFEASVAQELDFRKSAGEIESWEAQKTLDLVVNGYKIGTYRIDFVAYRKDGVTEYIEAKGWSTPLWKMKWAIFEAMMSEIPDVELAAKELDMPYVVSRWVGGTLTNWTEIKKRTSRLKELATKFEKGDLEKYTKKERLLFERELEKLNVEFGGIQALEGAPGALVIVDPREEHIAVEEASKMKVPTIALLNSDCNKQAIDYPVLANDSAIESIKFFLAQVKDAYQRGSRAK